MYEYEYKHGKIRLVLSYDVPSLTLEALIFL